VRRVAVRNPRPPSRRNSESRAGRRPRFGIPGGRRVVIRNLRPPSGRDSESQAAVGSRFRISGRRRVAIPNLRPRSGRDSEFQAAVGSRFRISGRRRVVIPNFTTIDRAAAETTCALPKGSRILGAAQTISREARQDVGFPRRVAARGARSRRRDRAPKPRAPIRRSGHLHVIARGWALARPSQDRSPSMR
jgi:hypothetical protein